MAPFANILQTKRSRIGPKRRPQRGVDAAGRLLLHARQDVGVDIEGGPDLRMPEPFANDLGVDALFQEQGRVGVPQAMEIDIRQLRLPHVRLETAGE